ncbi:MAG: ATP-dependent zinc metalloprotease FtsH [Nocardioides sp.]|uniref:ATP-dependent zinc metalloprotease FtsH n=1 Tax=Nocardioides sp. TaxID=35761 RepID=UPI0039E662B0
MKRIVKGPWLWIVLAVVGVLLALQYLAPRGGGDEISTGQMISYIQKDQVKDITFVDGDQQIKATLVDGTRSAGDKVTTHWVEGDQESIIKMVRSDDNKNLEEFNSEVAQASVLGSILSFLLPFILIVVLFLFLMNSVQGGGGRGVMQFAKSKAKLITKDMPKTTFADVAGVDEAVEELQEIKEFLAEPAKFQAVGAKIPKGVLLYGNPGTGKTLLARAVAGEAGVPFYSISGSDFVEMFVGVGASRVRDLFEQAKENAPAIVFIDEIDAVGRHRGAGMGGGHDEREQTLNQLLVEMDGFDVRGGVILIAATNRPDVLDPALLRPGRFDRQVQVDPPDLTGRIQILQVHARGKPLAGDIDLASVARRTPGFSGADLANVLNEAALLTARSDEKLITNRSLDEAIDRVIAGPQKRTRLMSEHEKLITAYHEGGHALVAAALPHNDPVHKITILPRGRALGYTMVLPDEDKYSQTRSEMLDKLAYMLGGRAAEEMIFHDPTTGAGNDIEKATNLARAMVTQYGMTERLGAIKLGESNSEPFLGRDLGHSRNYSEDVAAIVDEETKKLLANAHQEAYDVLEENRDVLDTLVLALVEKETLGKAEIAEIFSALRRRPDRPAWTGSETRKPSDRPAVTIPEWILERDKAASAPRDGGVAPGFGVAAPGVAGPGVAAPPINGQVNGQIGGQPHGQQGQPGQHGQHGQAGGQVGEEDGGTPPPPPPHLG